MKMASITAPKAPTAPASEGVAQPKRMEPFTMNSRAAGGRKQIRIKKTFSRKGT